MTTYESISHARSPRTYGAQAKGQKNEYQAIKYFLPKMRKFPINFSEWEKKKKLTGTNPEKEVHSLAPNTNRDPDAVQSHNTEKLCMLRDLIMQ